MNHSKTLKLALLGLACVVAWPASVQADTWNIDRAHSGAQFAVKHMLVTTVRGKLGSISGTTQWDGQDIESIRVDVTIDVAGLDTGHEKRDAHLRSDDFFDAANHPAIRFTSTRVVPAGNGRFQLIGDLTIRGHTREVVLDVDGPVTPIKNGPLYRTGASATTKLSRREFGLLWNRLMETGGAVVSDEVDVTIDLQLTRPTGETPTN